MKRLKLCAAITAALAALNWAFARAEEAATHLLMTLSGYDYGRAAARAPALVGMIFGIIGICALCGFCAWAQDREEKRLRKIRRVHARNGDAYYLKDDDR